VSESPKVRELEAAIRIEFGLATPPGG